MYWTVHYKSGPGRVINATVAVGDKIYSFGCSLIDDICFKRELMTVRVLNTRSYQWSTLPVIKNGDETYFCAPLQRTGHSAVVFKDIVYLWGGTTKDGQACNDLFCYDPSTWKWTRPEVTGTIPSARKKHLACVVGNSMYIIGGYGALTGDLSYDVYALDFRSLKWKHVRTEGGPLSCVAPFRSASVIASRVYILGREPTRYSVNRYHVIYFDTETGHWHRTNTTGSVPIMWPNHATFVYQGHVYVFGGYDASIKVRDKYLHRFCPDNNVWKLVYTIGASASPLLYSWHSCVMVDDRVFVLAGRGPRQSLQEMQLRRLHRYIPEAKMLLSEDLHVLDFSPTLRTLCLRIVHLHRLDTSCLPQDLKWEVSVMSSNILEQAYVHIE